MFRIIFIWARAVIKLILIIAFAPFILLYLGLKITVYRYSLRRGLRGRGLSGRQIKYLMSGGR